MREINTFKQANQVRNWKSFTLIKNKSGIFKTGFTKQSCSFLRPNHNGLTPVSADKWFCHSTSVFSHYLIYNTTDIWKQYEYFICSWRLDSYKYVYCDGRLVFIDCSLLWLINSGAPHTIRSEALKYESLAKCGMAISPDTFQFIHSYFAYYSVVPTKQQFTTWYKLASTIFQAFLY